MPIRLLDDRVVGKIAAGEVIERPASVVKELVENSLDAGASRIHVEIRQGGTGLIEVVDDGSGIPAAELPLAIQRHATSKLSEWDDLHTLHTLGFRGEALPSIAAVSDFTIRSRPHGQSAGAELSVLYGKVHEPRPTAAPTGTRVTVRNLFGNVPARKKFLRQAGTEASLISRFVAAYALARPDVAFELTNDGRRAFVTDGKGDAIAAAVAIWGAEISAAAIPLPELDEAARVPGVQVTGWIGAPAVTRSHRNGLIFLVNGRWIQNRALTFALEEAYHSLIMVGRHPIGVIHIELDPAMVDVNVHPTKAEVKFVDERAVCRAVQRTAHTALAHARPDEVPEIELGPIPWQAGISPLNGAASVRPTTVVGAEPTVAAPSVFPSAGFRPTPFEPRSREPDPLPVPNVAGRGRTDDAAVNAAAPVPVLRVLGQVGATYIIAEGPDGMFLIDQHAAHERVMYEKILAQLQNNAVDRQPLLDPMVVELAPDEFAAYERSTEELRLIGFDVEPFGPESIAVRGIPAMMRGVNIAERLREILQELAEGGSGQSWLDAVAISAACHTAIRAGQVLSLAEMRELVAELERTSQPRACGHGRPTMLHLSQTELEKQFARR